MSTIKNATDAKRTVAAWYAGSDAANAANVEGMLSIVEYVRSRVESKHYAKQGDAVEALGFRDAKHLSQWFGVAHVAANVDGMTPDTLAAVFTALNNVKRGDLVAALNDGTVKRTAAAIRGYALAVRKDRVGKRTPRPNDGSPKVTVPDADTPTPDESAAARNGGQTATDNLAVAVRRDAARIADAVATGKPVKGLGEALSAFAAAAADYNAMVKAFADAKRASQPA